MIAKVETSTASVQNRISKNKSKSEEWAEAWSKLQEAKAAYEKFRPVEKQIKELLEAKGVESGSVCGVKVSLKRTDSVKRKKTATAEEVIGLLREMGKPELVSETYSANSVKKMILDDAGILPNELTELFDVEEEVKLSIS